MVRDLMIQAPLFLLAVSIFIGAEQRLVQLAGILRKGELVALIDGCEIKITAKLPNCLTA